MKNDKISKLIKKYLKEHRKINTYPDGEFYTDCAIVDNQMYRVAPQKQYMGTKEEWLKAKKDEKEMDKNIGCLFCKFCSELNNSLKEEKK